MRSRGEITIFLVLILSVISVFIIGLSDLERRYISRSEAEYATDVALRSCFAEYNRELFERYHILLIDSSYKTSDNGKDRVTDHLEMYIDGNISHNEICSVDIQECGNAGEDNYRYLYNAAVGYAKENLQPDPRFSGQGDDSCFCTYLLSVFGNCHAPSDNCTREGETEYLLFGYEKDADNIDSAVSEYEEQQETEYEDYLCRRLGEEDADILRKRFADLVTEYMCKNGSPGFDPDTCYYDITVKTDLKGSDSYGFCITRRYTYDNKDS